MAKFFGVIFDRKVTFLLGILNSRTKCEKSLNILKILSNASWGADHVSLLKIYQTITRSKMDYACEIYSSAGISYLKKFDTVHHFALCICSGAFRTSPDVSTYVDTVEPALCLICEKLSFQLYYPILSHLHHPLRTHILTKEHDMLYENCPSCIPNFGIRIRNILSGSSLVDTRVLLSFLTLLLGTSKAFPLSILLNTSIRPTPLLIYYFHYLYLTILNTITT